MLQANDADEKLVEMWEDSRYSLHDICRIMQLTMHAVQKAKHRLGLSRRTAYSYKKIDAKCVSAVPDTDEIAARAAEVRSRWTPEEEARRVVGSSAYSWRPPGIENACCP